ncbi:hypothetical protein [Actinomadura sp. WMMA1423]|uniref:hypothetical protein n=1 Tax=Actinomadura sp. WMMA1423 TaxID=2591108 RepID=UPI0011466213|nr:hypothetical protein [Actinomadura sp. WMMA1423]
MGQASLSRRLRTDDSVTLLLLRHLFPGWVIARDERGGWEATRRVSASDADTLLGMLVVADPKAARRATALLKEGK